MNELIDELQDGAESLWVQVRDAVPRIAVAIVFILIGWVVANFVRKALYRHWGRSHTESFARVMSKLTSWTLLGLFVLGATTIAFPSVKPVDLLAGFGFFSIAIGFAFQDILENTLSGVLLLFRQPFESGDQIKVNGIEGTVKGVTIRETKIDTYDGRLVIVPNADVYKNAIVVTTANEVRRDSFVVGVSYEDDLNKAQKVITDALRSVDGVAADKEPEALVTELGTSTININARFWADPAQHNVVEVRSNAITAVKRALDDAGIEMPCDIVAIQATDSYKAAVHDSAEVTASGSLVS